MPKVEGEESVHRVGERCFFNDESACHEDEADEGNFRDDSENERGRGRGLQ